MRGIQTHPASACCYFVVRLQAPYDLYELYVYTSNVDKQMYWGG